MEVELKMKKIEVPIWFKTHLTVTEAAAYTGIGENRLYQLAKTVPGITLMVGSKRLFKREALDRYLENVDIL